MELAIGFGSLRAQTELEFAIECSTCAGTCCDIFGAYSDDKLAEDEGSARRTEEEGGRSEGRKEGGRELHLC